MLSVSGELIVANLFKYSEKKLKDFYNKCCPKISDAALLSGRYPGFAHLSLREDSSVDEA
jgi:hypothetical protein